MNIYRNASEERLYNILASHALKMGYEIVRLHMFEGSRTPKLQVMIDRTDGKAVALGDCEKVSQAFSAILDVEEDSIDYAYALEISSAGVNRPLTRKKDYLANLEEKIEVNTYNAISDRKRFVGSLIECNDNGIILKLPDLKDNVAIEFALIKSAVLRKI